MPPSIAGTSTNRPRIAVIGGGISGLAAAHRVVELLPASGLSLFETSDRLGGVLETTEQDGYLIERSADNFLTSRPGGIELCRRLGMADDLLPTDESRRRAHVVRSGELLPIPQGFYLMAPRRLWPVLSSPILSWRGKLRLLAEPLVPPGSQLMAEQGDGGEERGVRDESVASFARRRLGREAYERLVQPLVAGIYTADAENLSMAATMPDFLSQERSVGSLLRRPIHVAANANAPHQIHATGARYGLFVAPRLGVGSIVAAVAKRLPADSIRLGTRVHAIRRAADESWSLDIGDPPRTERFDAVIVAVPAHAAVQLLKSADAKLASELAAIRYAGIAVVSCGFNCDQIANRLDGFGFVVPQVENRRIVAASYASHKFPGRAPEGEILIRTFVGGSLQPELLDLSDAELRRLVLDELSDLLRITGLPKFTDIARWPRAMPQYHVGHVDRVERIQRMSNRWPSLALAGNAYSGVGIPQCITSGETAAERVASMLTLRHDH